MIVTRIEVGALGTNCWLVSADEEGPLVVIDPGDDATLIEHAIGGRLVTAVVLTHGHFDHLGAAGEILELTGAPLLVHELDAGRIATAEPAGTGGALFGFHGHVSPAADRTLTEGDEVTAGRLSLMVLHTPGHTQGGISLLAHDPDGGAPHLFAGDTLFAGSVGRTDFIGGDSRQLAESIARKLAPLPAETVVHTGHGPDTTIGRESRINPFWPRA